MDFKIFLYPNKLMFNSFPPTKFLKYPHISVAFNPNNLGDIKNIAVLFFFKK